MAQKLALEWSPQQISGWLKQEFATHHITCRYLYEAIYRSLFIQTRGVLKESRRRSCVLRGGCVTLRATTR